MLSIAFGVGVPQRAAAASCVTDTEIESAFGAEVKAGAFAINTSRIGNRALCSGLTIAQALQRLRDRLVPSTFTSPSLPPASPAVAKGAISPTQAGLFRYVGKYNQDKVGGYIFLRNPSIASALAKARVPASVLKELDSYGVSGPIERDGDMLVAQGCFPHQCSEMHYKVYANARSGVAALCHFDHGAAWYSKAAPVAFDKFANPCPNSLAAAPADIADDLMGSTLPASREDAIDSSGRIWGEFSYPSDYIPADITACAVNIASGRETCVKRSLVHGRSEFYSVNVPPGRYHVYARTADAAGKKAYYTKSVVCDGGAGGESRCNDHTPVVITITAGATVSDVNPQDWYTD